MTDEAPPMLPAEVFNTPELRRQLGEALKRQRHLRYPRFWEAVAGDTRMFLKVRGEENGREDRWSLAREALRLSWETDAFLALLLYRARGRLLVHRVPVLPQLLHRASMALCQLDIGEPVIVEPGVYIPHGQVVIDGAVEIGTGTVITPWVTIGLIEGNVAAPKIGRYTMIGTGAKILGNVRVGSRAKIGANAVVLKDVADRTSVVGAPARPVSSAPREPGEKMRRAIAEKWRSEDAGPPPAGTHRDPRGNGG